MRASRLIVVVGSLVFLALAATLVWLTYTWQTKALFAADPNWGHIHGRFVLEGKPPTPQQLGWKGVQITDESLVVDSKNRGIANIFVYLAPLKHQRTIPVHSSYAGREHEDVAISIKGHRFIPHVAIIQTSQSLVMTNHDTVNYNPNISPFRNPGFNFVLRSGDHETIDFRSDEPLPVQLTGNIKPWLNGHLLVTEHPYATVTDQNGQFEIKHFPTGEWTLQTWHERAGRIQSVILDAKPTTWRKGRFIIRVESGENDMGDIRLSAELFRRHR